MLYEECWNFFGHLPCCGNPRLSAPWIEVLQDESDCLILVWGACSRGLCIDIILLHFFRLVLPFKCPTCPCSSSIWNGSSPSATQDIRATSRCPVLVPESSRLSIQEEMERNFEPGNMSEDLSSRKNRTRMEWDLGTLCLRANDPSLSLSHYISTLVLFLPSCDLNSCVNPEPQLKV